MLPYHKYTWGLFIVLILVLCSCQSQGETLTSSDAQDSSTDYIQYASTIFSTGRVLPIEKMTLSFSLSGHVEEILVQEGDFVESGDVIALLDQSLLLSDLMRAEADLALAQARYNKVLTGTHPYLQTEAEYEATSAASGTVFGLADATAQAADAGAAQARLDYLLAQPLPEDIAIAEAELDQAEAEVERVKTFLARAELVAPVDGTILNVYIHAHEYTSPGQSIVQLGDISNLAIETRLDDIEAAVINVGDTALVTFEALQDIKVDGNVISIKTELNGVESKNFVVLISLINPPASIKPGMIGDIRMQTE
jgi:multidrug efflux pump subunit AcrA (membrane-fusion protein)